MRAWSRLRHSTPGHLCRLNNLALTLVITAAILHATWNFLLKKSGGGIGVLTLSAVTATALLTPFSLYLIVRGFTFTPAMIGMIMGSGIIHLAYFLLLDRAYRGAGGGGGTGNSSGAGNGGDLSIVYPLARATGPLLTIVAATLFLGERMSPIAIGGALLIGVSALLLTGNLKKLLSKDAKSGARFALMCGSMIACYTLWDKQGVAAFLIPPIIFDWGANLVRIIMMIPLAHQRQPGAMTLAWRHHRKAILAIGVMSPLSYILVLTAMVFTPVSYVAPARELSILFAALIGTQILKEGQAARRSIAAVGMVLGISALALG